MILATGYRAAVGMLGARLIRSTTAVLRAAATASSSVDQPDLYFVGHNYDIRGGLFNIGATDARAARADHESRVRDTCPNVHWNAATTE